MLLPQTVEYALRAMSYIANLPEGEAARAKDLSVVTNVPGPYLSKLLRRMVVAGLLTSQKGHGGGFVLAKPPRFIRFLDVMVAADYEVDPRHCAFGWGACNTGKPCPMHPAWARLNEAMCDWAARVTLADVGVSGGLPSPALIVSGEVPGMADILGRAAADANPRKRRGRKPRAAVPKAE